ncbi:GntR family transcriptional regulator [Thermoanaerobacterium thermosaccharolyticum]|uniref:GntR family transcriptional regulator n=1 Tax=Thermoanaerobacterium thermosaccharolyticum TaxID=1517 RepID=UPI0027A22CA4|nr:GntR family transcriptional regulator [Thermoanaerobacterium thermosaccharolyticum]
MLLRIEFESDIPIYMQIKNQIIEGIALGMLKEGDELPSIRQLASDFGINLHTVKKAYDILKDEGFLSVHRRKGYVVTKNAFADDNFIEELKKNLQPILANAYSRGMAEDEILKICKEILEQFNNGM